MKKYKEYQFTPYYLLLPTMIIIVLFLFWPTLLTFIMSVYKQAPFGNQKVYVGINNYLKMFINDGYLNSLYLTFLYILFSVFLGLAVSLVLATLTNQKIKGIKIYRSFFFLPYAISPAVAGALWVFLLNPIAGHVNYFLSILFGIQPEWLTDKVLAFVSIIIAAVWKNIGFNIIFFLAGLQTIPVTVYEAAKIDGASSLRTFFTITFPLLSPTTFYLLIMNIIFAAFYNFGIVDVMTKGGPANGTNFLIYNLYKDAFVNFKPGQASAQSVVLFIIILIVTLFQFKTIGNKVHYQ